MAINEPEFMELTSHIDLPAFWSENQVCEGFTPQKPRCAVFFSPDDPSRYDGYQAVLESRGEKFVVVNLGFSLYERAWTLVGMENLMMAKIEVLQNQGLRK